MSNKKYTWDIEWLLIFKKQHVFSLPHPERHWFGLKPSTCPLCHEVLIQTNCEDNCVINYWVEDCECGYQYANSNGKDTESFTETDHYLWLDVSTGKDYPNDVCQKILDQINLQGNVEAQKELIKLNA